MSPSDHAAIRQRNAESLATLDFIQREIAAQPARPKREPSILEPLHPPGWSEEVKAYVDNPAERELTMRGLRGWWRMMHK